MLKLEIKDECSFFRNSENICPLIFINFNTKENVNILEDLNNYLFKMRELFVKYSKIKRNNILEKILHTVPKKSTLHISSRQLLRNLLNDKSTPDLVVDDIIEYFIQNGFWDFNKLRDKWIQKCSQIKIRNPKLLLTIQNVETIRNNIIQKFGDEDIYGISFDKNLEIETILENIFKLKEIISINNKYLSKPEIIPFRIPYESNLWVTWNEISPNQVSDLMKEKKESIISKLGLGYIELDNEVNYLGCVIEDDKDQINLYIPGWGDAITYHYWRPNINEPILYGYTYPLNENFSDRQPEAVTINQNLNIINLHKDTFLLK